VDIKRNFNYKALFLPIVCLDNHDSNCQSKNVFYSSITIFGTGSVIWYLGRYPSVYTFSRKAWKLILILILPLSVGIYVFDNAI